MKFEKITDVKIKIILSLQDMKSNNVSAEKIISNSKSSQKLLQNILNRAEKEIGFDAGDSKLLVEAIMSSDVECIFTITKLDTNQLHIEKRNNLFIFKFDCFDDFVALCNFLNSFSFLCLKDISKNFSLFYYNNTYYLKFAKDKNYSIAIDYIKTFFNEFGEEVSNSTNIEGFLNEYGRIIFPKDAIIKCLYSFNKK